MRILSTIFTNSFDYKNPPKTPISAPLEFTLGKPGVYPTYTLGLPYLNSEYTPEPTPCVFAADVCAKDGEKHRNERFVIVF